MFPRIMYHEFINSWFTKEIILCDCDLMCNYFQQNV